MSLAGLVLMGGKNSRMNGEKKAFLLYKGYTFFEHAMHILQELDKVYLSVEEKNAYKELDYELVVDLYNGIGPMGGIYTALITCPEDALLVIPCDMPKLTKELVREIVSAYKTINRPVFLQSDGRKNPLIGIYTKDCIPIIEKMISDKNYKMTKALESISHSIVDLESIEATNDNLLNINTPDDYKQLDN